MLTLELWAITNTSRVAVDLAAWSSPPWIGFGEPDYSPERYGRKN